MKTIQRVSSVLIICAALLATAAAPASANCVPCKTSSIGQSHWGLFDGISAYLQATWAAYKKAFP